VTDDEAKYKATLAEFRDRLVKYANKVRDTERAKRSAMLLIAAGGGLPPEPPVAFEELFHGLNLDVSLQALVLLLAEQEMRLRKTEATLGKIEGFARELVAEIRHQFGQDKLDELVRAADEKSKKEAN
jgi:hypothetical protein